MKYKYIVGLLVALGFSNAFAADEEITAKDYQQIYLAFRCGGTAEINAALENNQTFNHKDDTDIIRSSQTGLALRKAVIGLNAADLRAVFDKNHEFFTTSLGTSLIYGWTLNQFKEPITPYYIGDYFSFDKLFQGLAGKMADHDLKFFLKGAFTLGLSAVEADRWAFYDHMLYLPYAIEQVGAAGAYDLSIDDVIRMSRRTKEEAKAEKQALHNTKLLTILIDDSADLCDLVNASHLDPELDERTVSTYFDQIKDKFLGEFVSGKHMIELQYLVTLIKMGAGDERGVLRSIPVKEEENVLLNAKLVGTTSKASLAFEDEHELETLGQLCNYVLGVYEDEEAKQIRAYDELYQAASTFRVGNVVPDNIKSIQDFAELLKDVLKMSAEDHTTIQSLIAKMALEKGKNNAQITERKKRKAALTQFVKQMQTIPEKFKTGETAYAR